MSIKDNREHRNAGLLIILPVDYCKTPETPSDDEIHPAPPLQPYRGDYGIDKGAEEEVQRNKEIKFKEGNPHREENEENPCYDNPRCRLDAAGHQRPFHRPLHHPVHISVIDLIDGACTG